MTSSRPTPPTGPPSPAKARGSPSAPHAVVATPSNRPGMEALRLAVHRPDAVVDRLDEVLFLDDLQRRAFVALTEADSLHQAVEEAPPDVADLLRRVTVEEPVLVDNPITDPVDAVVAQLVRAATRQAMVQAQAAVRTSNGDLGSAAAQTAVVRHWLDELDDPDTGRGAADRLLAWLLAGGEEA